MTKLLEKAFEEASETPEKEQDALARALLEELASETLEILTDRKLYPRLRRTAETLEDDVRKGRLGSLEEAFGEEQISGR